MFCLLCQPAVICRRLYAILPNLFSGSMSNRAYFQVQLRKMFLPPAVNLRTLLWSIFSLKSETATFYRENFKLAHDRFSEGAVREELTNCSPSIIMNPH